ncbi:MAG TPA: type VI secretion system membrane subunit TssM [Polyangiaceae bacterium]|nr:type VI secretion system membrane subunit TssM [Polyangiaceae bacterium]
MLLAAILFSIFLVAGSWLTVLLLPLPWWVGLVATTLAILIIIGVLVFRRLRAVARASALERELMRQAAQHADQARPDRRPEVLALQANMKQAIEALKRSKLAKKGGKTALYALPWYVIVGPPAAGKTTALEQSGLAFSSPVANTPKIKGTAGTRNCDWWFSQEAILLDTAGRFATDDDDREEWIAFLETIKRFRSERPLDGVIVALSTADLAGASDAQLEDLAAKLRSRIDEITARLEMVVPIYVMFTKADLVAGFAEFFGDLGKQQRGQPWGATFLMDDERLSDAARACDAEFDVLVKTLHARMIERLAREPLPEVRARVLQFPIELAALRAPIAHFIEQLVQPNPYQETPILRGFYFTSGTQVGRPMDRVLASMARGFDLGPLPALGQMPQGQSVSYFVTDLFRNIVFPDRHLAVRSTSLLQRYARRQILYGAGALFLTMMLVLPAAITYLNDSDLVRATARDVDEVTRLEKAKGRGSAAVTEALGVLSERMKILEQARSGFRLPGFVGSSAAAPLYEPVRALYASRVREIVDGAVKKQIRDDVRAIGESTRADADSFQTSYETLKLYVMMASPDHLDVDWATSHLADKWARALRGEGEVAAEKLVAPSRFYVESLAADRTWVWASDESILGRARSRLSRLPFVELQYGWLLSSAEGVAPIRPEKIFYGPADQFIGARSRDVEVPGAYTAAGWDKIRGLLEGSTPRLVIEPWVIGGVMRDADEAQRMSTEQLREMYYRRYEQAWSDFLGGIVVQTPSEIRTAIEELTALSETEGPYTRLFRAISENVRLDMEPPTLAGKLLDKGKDFATAASDKVMGKDAEAPGERKVSPVERYFKSLLRFGSGDGGGGKADIASTGLSQYLGQVSNLAIALRQLAESKSQATTEFQSELARTAAGVERLLNGVDAGTRLLLEPLLMNPIRGGRQGVITTGNAILQEKWQKEVYELWSGKLAPRYPFADGAGEEVSLAEFSDFFRPTGGALWKFYDKNLTEYLDRTGNAFALKATVEAGSFRPDFLRCLSHAAEISDALYGTAPEPLVSFGLRMHSVGAQVSEITFRVDGQATVYRNEPERWVGAQWPGKGTPKAASIQVKGAGFTDETARSGDFGFFRLLAASGGLKAAGADGSLVANFSLTRPGLAAVPVDFRPAKAVHPFHADFFRRLKCPAEVLQEGSPAPTENARPRRGHGR